MSHLIRTTSRIGVVSLILALAAPLGAQAPLSVASASRDTATTQKPESTTAQKKDSATVETSAAARAALQVKPIIIQHIRPMDQRGINMFEPPKEAGVPFEGFRVSFGAAFAQQFQGLSHANSAAPVVVNNVNMNQLMTIGHGFNNATANLYLDAQLAKGIRVAMTTYLSARHHQDTWVKDGYLLIDDSPIDKPVLNSLMKYLTMRIGHFEVNYGDQHYRRSDNGAVLYNPFVGNLVLDAFTTEIGGEAYVRAHDLIAMGAVTGGEIRGDIQRPTDRSPAYIGKLGFDHQFLDNLRIRMTGSMYSNRKSPSNTLYSGDRAGSRYYLVLENTAATTDTKAWSGDIQPGFSRTVKSYQFNPFVRFAGFEYFGTFESTSGHGYLADSVTRSLHQVSNELIYRFLDRDQLFVGARYNTVKGEMLIPNQDQTVKRTQLGLGWFVTPSMMLKGEYVTQKYVDFPTADIRHNGKFNGFMIEAGVAF